MQAVFVDIWNELRDVGREASHLAVALSRHTDQAVDIQDTWEQTHIRASAIEKIYSGCERVMIQIASGIDGAPVDHSDGWHVALLKRLAYPFPGIREPVITMNCYTRLDRLRSFRHRERNSYGIDLDAGIVLERAREAVEILRAFEDEIRHFMIRHGFDPVTADR